MSQLNKQPFDQRREEDSKGRLRELRMRFRQYREMNKCCYSHITTCKCECSPGTVHSPCCRVRKWSADGCDVFETSFLTSPTWNSVLRALWSSGFACLVIG